MFSVTNEVDRQVFARFLLVPFFDFSCHFLQQESSENLTEDFDVAGTPQCFRNEAGRHDTNSTN
jgi:hypothetical protein